MGAVTLVVLAHVLRAATKKGRQLFLRKKMHSRENPGYAYVIAKAVLASRLRYEVVRMQHHSSSSELL